MASSVLGLVEPVAVVAAAEAVPFSFADCSRYLCGVLDSGDAFGPEHSDALTLAETSSDVDAVAVVTDAARMEIDVLDSLGDNVNTRTWAA